MELSIATSDASITASLTDALYADALLLADESRAWFDLARGTGSIGVAADADADASTESADPLFHWAGRHDPSLRIALSCESLRLTTRLMHVIAWLLMQRAISVGELPPSAALAEHNRLGPSPECDPVVRDRLPVGAQRLIDASIRLHQRVAQLDAAVDAAPPAQHPVHDMMARLALAL
jgi:regulator of CtrA degradation